MTVENDFSAVRPTNYKGSIAFLNGKRYLDRTANMPNLWNMIQEKEKPVQEETHMNENPQHEDGRTTRDDR